MPTRIPWPFSGSAKIACVFNLSPAIFKQTCGKPPSFPLEILILTNFTNGNARANEFRQSNCEMSTVSRPSSILWVLLSVILSSHPYQSNKLRVSSFRDTFDLYCSFCMDPICLVACQGIEGRQQKRSSFDNVVFVTWSLKFHLMVALVENQISSLPSVCKKIRVKIIIISHIHCQAIDRR